VGEARRHEGLRHRISRVPARRAPPRPADQRESVQLGERLLLVDYWIESGSQASAVQHLVEACGAVLAGIAVMVDQLDDAGRASLPPISSLVTANELSGS
jgi:orotate phosphoribosyltransferase